MARIDSILAIVLQQGANELRVGTDREPKMLAHGSAKRFLMPKTNEETLRELLGEIMTPAREQLLRERGRVETSYETEAGSPFQVSLTKRADGGFDAVFLRSARSSAASASSAHVRAAPSPSSEEPIDVVATHRAPVSSPILEAASPSTPQIPVTRARSASLPPASRELIDRALSLRGTDLHLVDDDTPMVRVDGRLQRLDEAPVDNVLELLGVDANSRAAITNGASVELGLDLENGGRGRIHLYRTSTGTAAAIRFVGALPMSLSSLNMPVPLEDLIEIPHGLVLICGATGSGKSTTLASLAQEALRRRSVMLVTLEDPIEYVLTGGSTSIVRQRQVGRDVRDFASGLRDALREDPDILVVGEMRDPETIALALTAAETGHLVFATLHSGSTASAIERIIDATPTDQKTQIRSQIADSLRVIVAQRLLPRARGGGRIPALEVLRVNHAAASLIREGKTVQLTSVLQSGRNEKMIQLERSLADRVNAGEVRLEHAKAAANDVAALMAYITK